MNFYVFLTIMYFGIILVGALIMLAIKLTSEKKNGEYLHIEDSWLEPFKSTNSFPQVDISVNYAKRNNIENKIKVEM